MFHVVMPSEGTNFHFPPTLLESRSLTLYYISASASLPRIGWISLRIGPATTIIYRTLMSTERIISTIYYFPSCNNDIYSFYGLDTVGKSSLSPCGRYSLQIVRIWNFPSFVGKRNKTVNRTPPSAGEPIAVLGLLNILLVCVCLSYPLAFRFFSIVL